MQDEMMGMAAPQVPQEMEMGAAPEGMDMEYSEEDLAQFLPPEVLREMERQKVKDMLKQLRQKELEDEMSVMQASRMGEIDDEANSLFQGKQKGY
jgi:hypothetical protein